MKIMPYFFSLQYVPCEQQASLYTKNMSQKYCLKVTKFPCNSFSGLRVVEKRSEEGREGGRPDRVNLVSTRRMFSPPASKWLRTSKWNKPLP